MTDNRPEWVKVQEALANSEWDFRTVDGIATETRLPPGVVEGLLGVHRSEIRQTVSRGGRPLYTLKSRPRKFLREALAGLHLFASR